MAQVTGQHIRRGDRRSVRAKFAMPERRTGYDRRSAGGFLHRLSDEPALLLGMLILLNALSLADWALTLRALEAGAVEANAALGALLDASPLAAGAFKVAVMLGVSTGIWYLRRYRIVAATAVGALVVYALVISYHALAATTFM